MSSTAVNLTQDAALAPEHTLHDHINDYLLPTTFSGEYVEHRIAYSDRHRGIRKRHRRERWKTDPEPLGRGGFGVVRLQKEKKSQQLRAVKEVLHNSTSAAVIDPIRELIAMAALSKVRLFKP